MTKAPMTLGVSQCQDLETAWDWTEWLMKAAKSTPDIEAQERHVLALWMPYQHVREFLDQWIDARELAPEEFGPLEFAREELERAVFTAIIEARFEIETAAGLTIMLSIISTQLKQKGASIEEYQEALRSATMTASKLAHIERGIDFEGDQPILPTMH